MKKMMAAFMLLTMIVGTMGCGTQSSATEEVKEVLASTPEAVDEFVKETEESAVSEVVEPQEEAVDYMTDFTEYDSQAGLLEPYGIKFGTVINYNSLKDEKFLELTKTHFNRLTTGNEMKAYSLLD